MQTLIKSTLFNRKRLYEEMKEDNNYYYMEGIKTMTREYSDVEINFRQDSNFFGYLE